MSFHIILAIGGYQSVYIECNPMYVDHGGMFPSVILSTYTEPIQVRLWEDCHSYLFAYTTDDCTLSQYIHVLYLAA